MTKGCVFVVTHGNAFPRKTEKNDPKIVSKIVSEIVSKMVTKMVPKLDPKCVPFTDVQVELNSTFYCAVKG